MQTEFPGMLKKPRPKKSDPKVVEKLKVATVVVLDKLMPDDEGNEVIADYLVDKMTLYHEIDGYLLAKAMDDRFYTMADFEVADAFNDLHWKLDEAYGAVIKEWIEEQQIVSPVQLGDMVKVNILGEEVEGEIIHIYEDSARVSVYCESLDHIRSDKGLSGTTGVIIDYENLTLLEKGE